MTGLASASENERRHRVLVVSVGRYDGVTHLPRDKRLGRVPDGALIALSIASTIASHAAGEALEKPRDTSKNRVIQRVMNTSSVVVLSDGPGCEGDWVG